MKKTVHASSLAAALATLSAVVVLGGCGQKGPLMPADKPADKPTGAAPAAAAASDARSSAAQPPR